MASTATDRYVLGLDIGANSVGWACIRLDDAGNPTGLLHRPELMAEQPSLGVRIFERGVENYEQGQKEETRGVQRRMARQQRRQAARRARRLKRTFRILQEAGLLPAFEPGAIREGGSQEAARDLLLKTLDSAIAQRIRVGEHADRHQLLPYLLRRTALDARLEPFQLGRALYHLAQRRGFKTSRRSGARDEDVGVVKKDIARLAADMSTAGSRTLGEHLYVSAKSGKRVRRQWTARAMYLAEFEAIWQAQAPFHSQTLTSHLRRVLHRAIFHQRPLRSQRDSVGLCELEDGGEYMDLKSGEVRRAKRRRRAPECFLVSQRFRLLQSVNNLRIELADGSSAPLSDAQRVLLASELEHADSMTFAAVAQALGLPKRTKFNLQAGGEKRILGNRTNAGFLAVFGNRWAGLDDEQRHVLVLELWAAADDEAVRRRALARTGPWASVAPTPADVESLESIRLSPDYMSLSSSAMSKLLPLMEAGARYDQAVEQAFGKRVSTERHEVLPPARKALPELRNPVVSRALTELRRVVNAVVKLYGRPEIIRVELARDLKRNKLDRQRLAKEMRANESERESAREEIRRCEEAGISNPTAGDILRLRLHRECGGLCPYTGRPIAMAQLFRGDVDIEHIVPLSISLDDSYLNKTLCFADVNRRVKQKRTPFEAFGAGEEQWREMVRRMEISVERHGMPAEKLRRFQLQGEELEAHLSQFASSQLNDTRYASRLARRYLALLFGGDLAKGVDASGRVRVQVGNGQLTALLRTGLGMNRFVVTERGDKRSDHRHHAVDAVATALSVPALLKRVSDHAADKWTRRDRLGPVPSPWSSFTTDVSAAIDKAVVSFRIDNRVRGALHTESLYSPERDSEGKVAADGGFVHKREPLEKVKRKDFDRIVDPRVREIVVNHFGEREPADVLDPDDASTWPSLPNSRGPSVPIRRVRLRSSRVAQAIGSGPRVRHVYSDENHHLELFAGADKRAKPVWTGRVVSLAMAHERLRNGGVAGGISVVDRSDGFVFSLAKNDSIVMDDATGRARLYVVRGFSQFASGKVEIEIVGGTDARLKKEIPKQGRTTGPNVMRQRNCRKVVVSPIGVVRPCRA